MSSVKTCIHALLTLGLAVGAASWLASCDWRFLGLSRDVGGDDADFPRTVIADLQCSADGRTLLSVVRGDITQGSPLLLHRAEQDFQAQPVPVGGAFVLKAALVADGSAVIVADDSRQVSRIELSTRLRVALMSIPRTAVMDDLAVSPDGRLVAIAIDDEVVLCDGLKGGELLRMPIGSVSAQQIAFSDSGRLFAAGTGDGMLRIWKIGDVQPYRALPVHSGGVSQLRFFDHDRKIATGGLFDNILRISDVATGESLCEIPVGPNSVKSLAVSPDGRTAATGGLDRRIRLWELPSGKPLRILSEHSGAIGALHFTKDGKSLISAADGIIRFRDRDFTISGREIDAESARPVIR